MEIITLSNGQQSDGVISREWLERHYLGPTGAEGLHRMILPWATAISLSPKRDGSSNKGNRGGEWDMGVNSLREAQALARGDGWRDGWARVQQEFLRLSARLRASRLAPETRLRPVPYRVPHMDMGRVIAGRPDCWVQRRHTGHIQPGGHGQIVRLLVDIAADARVSAEIMASRGMAIMLAAEGLRAIGKTPIITVGVHIRSRTENKTKFQLLCPLPSTLTPSQSMFALGHPAFFRRIGFSWIEHCPHYTGKSYGKIYQPNRDTALADLTVLSSSCVGATGLPAVEWASPSSVEQWVLALLASQGVEVRS